MAASGSWPLVKIVDQVTGDGSGQGVELSQDVLWIDQLDDWRDTSAILAWY